jgi:PTH1 family peptidyl-tRNA hydrolase
LSERWLFAGLGNPGGKYQLNRHNVGFLFLDQLAGRSSSWRKCEGGEYLQLSFSSANVYLLKPLEYMNNSGRAVAGLANFLDLPADKLVVIHDEVEIPYLKMRLKRGGGHAGHNGIKSISQHLSTADFFRLRLGVGRPENPQFDLANWVLSDFSKLEQSEFSEFFGRAEQCLKTLLESGLGAAQGRYNS